ncbi:MAG TPA: SMP-30/gluconolactonase/LRE family protein [Telluria sp.]|nr:SMP-30/gluconolactonase/LRE family protein [Telluria sp.]
MTREYEASCVWPVSAELGEGPMWSAADGRLYFVDILAARLHAYSPANGERRSWAMPDYICWLVPRRDGDGFMAGLRDRVVRLWLEPEVRIEALDLPLGLEEGVRLNDAKADRHGNLWFGCMHGTHKQRPLGRLFRLTPDLALTEHARDVHICNGPAFAPGGERMLHTDSLTGCVYAYPLDADGAPAHGPSLWRAFDGAREGSPDGMTFDGAGGLWIAQWGAGRVCRYRADGSVDAVVRVPVSQPSSCAFGGPDLATLFITSAREDLTPERLAAEPLAGALFAIRLDVPGLLPAHFG